MDAKRQTQLRLLFQFVIEELSRQNANQRWLTGLCLPDEEVMKALLGQPYNLPNLTDEEQAKLADLNPTLQGLTLEDVKVAAQACKPMIGLSAKHMEQAIDSWEAALPLAKEILALQEESRPKCPGGCR